MVDDNLSDLHLFPTRIKGILLEAASAGLKFRITKRGVMFYGRDGGMVTIHRTESDHRAERNTIARFRRIGFDPKGKK